MWEPNRSPEKEASPYVGDDLGQMQQMCVRFNRWLRFVCGSVEMYQLYTGVELLIDIRGCHNNSR